MKFFQQAPIRDKERKILFGVLSGFAGASGVDPFWPRLIFVLIMLATGFVPMIFVYFIFASIMKPDRVVRPYLKRTPFDEKKIPPHPYQDE